MKVDKIRKGDDRKKHNEQAIEHVERLSKYVNLEENIIYLSLKNDNLKMIHFVSKNNTIYSIFFIVT